MALRLKGLKGTKGREEQRQGVFRGMGELSQQARRGFDLSFCFVWFAFVRCDLRSHVSQTGLYNPPACTFRVLGLQDTPVLWFYVMPRVSCTLSKYSIIPSPC